MHLKIVTHERIVFDDTVDEIYSRSVDGEFGILKGHVPFMTALDVGVTKVVNDGHAQFFTTMGGMLQFTDDEAVILTHSSECCSDIDVARANEAKERAEARLREKEADLDAKRAEAALARALVRLKAAIGK